MAERSDNQIQSFGNLLSLLQINQQITERTQHAILIGLNFIKNFKITTK